MSLGQAPKAGVGLSQPGVRGVEAFQSGWLAAKTLRQQQAYFMFWINKKPPRWSRENQRAGKSYRELREGVVCIMQGAIGLWMDFALLLHLKE